MSIDEPRPRHSSTLTALLWAVALGLMPLAAAAASFDCQQARAPQERFICAHEDISRL